MEFLESSTIHGLSYISTAKVSPFSSNINNNQSGLLTGIFLIIRYIQSYFNAEIPEASSKSMIIL